MEVAAVSNPLIEARGLCKRYGAVMALDALDLSVQPGEMFGLIGPDGAGKSSLMKTVAGVLSYEVGTLKVFGTDMQTEAATESVKGKLGLMPQGLGQNLYPELSIEENVDFFARLRLVPADVAAERKEQLLAMTRLAAFRSRPMKQLSGGMKQKLGLVCTLIHAPELIVLDEPTTGVDPVSRRDFWAILSELLQETRSTALVSTAYMDEASAFDRVALMHEGRILAMGTPDAIRLAQPGAVLTLPDLSGDEVQTLAREIGYMEPRGSEWRLYVPEVSGAAATLKIGGVLKRPVQATVAEPDLEDAFIARVGEAQVGLPVTAQADQSDVAEPLIVADGLTRTFGAFRAVDNATFKVMPGEVFGLLGANGAGKTTVIKMLTGILQPSEGMGHVAGADMRTAGREIKSRIGYMSQAFSLYTDLTAIENIRLYAAIYGLDAARTRERVDWIVQMAGLAGHEQALAASLPMGLRQRLALGCALVHSPRVLFLDEPTSGVDPIGRRQFWDILFRLAREDQVAVLVTTHYMSEAERCDDLALMFAGKVVASGSPAKLKSELIARRGALMSFDCSDPRKALSLLRDSDLDIALHGRKLHLFAPDPEAVRVDVTALLSGAGMAVERWEARPVSMEDVFVALMTELEHSA
ncbi:ATP-binding cassette domain-containing protein [Burkholderiaceae bacterium DAT-1]|nr:ATP-binding cassette domain-containing protein [Burkholderiaceae bacterium DAT-1]